jgi:transcriptional regulator with XRE-family HTH domain
MYIPPNTPALRRAAMNTLEYLDAAKKRLGIESDYALAKAMKVRPSTISNYRARRSEMDDEIAAKVAGILGVHPGFVMLDIHRERAKTPEERSIWADIYKGFQTLLPHARSGGEERRRLPRVATA